MFIICRFERTICKSYNKVSNFIVLIHKYHRIAFVHSARQQKTAGFSPSPSLLRKSTSPKGRGLGKEMKFVWIAKGSHFGGAGIEQSEMTERARMLPLYNNFFLRKRAGGNAIVCTFDDSNKKSPQKLDGNSKRNPTQNCKTVI